MLKRGGVDALQHCARFATYPDTVRARDTAEAKITAKSSSDEVMEITDEEVELS